MRHALRILLITLALVLLGLALTPRANSALGVAPPCAPDLVIPYGWHLWPPNPCGGDSVSIVFTSCQDCVDLISFEWGDSTAGLTLRMRAVCPLTLVCRPDSVVAPVGRLAAGQFRMNFMVHAEVVSDSAGSCTLTRLETIDFTVGRCTQPPGSLPYTDLIQIGPPPPCADCAPRICPDQPIPFAIAGAFPDGCYELRSLELLPSPIVGPRQEPPIVRLIVNRHACPGCTLGLKPWAADTLLPALPPGAYELMLQMVVMSECDSMVGTSTTYNATKAFTVKDSCQVPPETRCLIAGWEHLRGYGCDAFLGAAKPAQVTMTVAARPPLAGLQGVLSFHPAGLRIAALEPVGSAAGAHLSWEPTADGAKFVMFSDQGAPIGLPDSNVRCMDPLVCASSVLRVTLVPSAGAEPPPVTHLVVHDLLGSDALGAAVPECQIATLVVVEAQICAGPSCDFNQDGALDVRDLVSMVHCVLHTGPCPDTSIARLDCNGDGRLGVDDVLCCAGTILRGGARDTTAGRPEPGVAVQLGEPDWQSGNLRVPIHLLAADRVGAARLVLALPLDRYDVAGVETGAAGQWIELHEAVDGKLVVGLIGLGPGQTAGEPSTLDLTLRLALKPGQRAGGDIGLADLQLSGRDGVTLAVPVPTGTVPLPSPGSLLLSAARPNPFARETRFALNLDRAADVDLAIHDLSGRRVYTVFRGALGAGPHDFAWRGTGQDGSTAANGIYFLQARVGGERLVRKVIFLRGN